MAKIIFAELGLGPLLGLIFLAGLIGSTFAGNLTYTSCRSTNGFQVNSFDISTCDQSSCLLNATQVYQITIEGQDLIQESITALPFECTAQFVLTGPIPFKFLCGNLCSNFSADSPTQSCPISAPASGKFLINYQPPFGLAKDRTPSKITCKVWKNTKSGIPAACVTFKIELAKGGQGDVATFLNSCKATAQQPAWG